MKFKKIQKILFLLFLSILLSVFCVPVNASKIKKEPKIIIEPQFEYVESFYGGLAVFNNYNNEGHGYIDKFGNIVFEQQFDIANPFGRYSINPNIARVRVNSKYGYVENTGRTLLEPIYDNITILNFDTAAVEKDGKVGIINFYDDQEVDYRYDARDIPFEGFLPVSIDNKWGFVNRNGEEIANPIYEKVNRFTEGFAGVKKNGKWGFINTGGEEVVPPQFEAVSIFSEGLAPVKKNGKWGYIDRFGNIAIKPQYEEVRLFADGIASFKKWGMWGILNSDGKEIRQPQYYRVEYFENGGLAVVSKGGLWGFVDYNGNEVTELKYKGWHYLLSTRGTAIGIRNDEGKYALMDLTGREITKFEYDDFRNVSNENEGIVYVEKDGKTGLIDDDGVIVVPPIYDSVTRLSKNSSQFEYTNYMLLQRRGEDSYVTDMKGNVISTITYPRIKVDIENSIISVRNEGLAGYTDFSGRELIERQFITTDTFSEGLARVEVYGKLKWGFIASPLDVPSDWAKSEVDAGVALNLIPNVLNYGYKENMTRIEFSKLLKQFIVIIKNNSIEEILSKQGKTMDRTKFIDTRDEDVLFINALGVANGKSNKIFDPYGKITREEAAVMLHRTAKLLHLNNNQQTLMSDSLMYDDNDKIQQWAEEAVYYVSSLMDKETDASVMGGTGNNLFRPDDYFTKEQSFIAMKRLFNSQ